jgi:hypothetical protein
MHEGQMYVRTSLTHAESGSIVEAVVPMPIPDSTPQKVGSALTYGRRYSLCLALGIVADEDDDAEAAQKPVQRAQASTPAPQHRNAAQRPAAPATEQMVDMVEEINPDGSEPYYLTIADGLEGSCKAVADFIYACHVHATQSGGPASKQQYGLLAGTIDKLVGKDNHHFPLSVLCRSAISKDNPPSKLAASKLLDTLQADNPKRQGLVECISSITDKCLPFEVKQPEVAT